jgi:oligoendopeptidase F
MMLPHGYTRNGKKYYTSLMTDKEKALHHQHATWDLSPLFANDDDPKMAEDQSAVERLSSAFIHKWKDRDDYTSDPAALFEALTEYESWALAAGTSGVVGYYFWLRTQQNESSPELKARWNKLEEFSTKIANDMQFFTHRISLIPIDKHDVLLNNEKLLPYRHFLQRLFAEARFLLSEPEEKIMTLKSSVAHDKWESMLSSFLSKELRPVEDEDGSTKEKTFEEIMALLSHTRKITRDSAARALNDILKAHLEVGEAELNAILLNKRIDDNLRNVPRPDLLRHIHDNIESDVVDTALTAIEKRFDIPQRFYKLKARLLGVDKLQYHERNVTPYSALEKEYSFEEACDLVRRVFTKLHPKFGEIFSSMIQEGRVDVYPRTGKRGGAFCVGWRKNLPVYVMLNFTNKLADVTTLAHEMGHAINDIYVQQSQNELCNGVMLSTAEVASTFMEDFVFEELLFDADEKTKRAIVLERLNDDISTIFRQTACYRFEQELHKNFRAHGYLSKEAIGALFQKHMKAYMGDAVEQTPETANWWLYWSHIRNFFYVYSYATGLLISKALQADVRADSRNIQKVVTFLSAGRSASTRDIFLSAGVDIAAPSFWEHGLEEIDRRLVEAEGFVNNSK